MQDAAMPVFLPSGEICSPLPVEDSAWSDCLRDLKRTLEGGCLYLLGRGRCFCVRDPAKVPGDVSDEACERAFSELVKVIGFELHVQAMGLTTDVTASGACWHPSCVKPARHDGPCVDGFLRRQPLPEGCVAPLEPEVLEGLVRRVAANVSVIPGMEAVMKHSLPPALWQPSFIVCIGNGQIRVLTLAFVGDPICGDRPSSKSTPFVLRLVTDNLVPAPTDSRSPGVSYYCVRNALAGAETVALHLADLAEELFTASATGDWTSLTKAEMKLPLASSISSFPAPRVFITHPEGTETPRCQVGTRNISVSRARRKSRLELPCSPSPSHHVQPTVSVLADGLSVKAVTSAWSNMTSAKLGMLVSHARSQSPGWARAVASATVSQQCGVSSVNCKATPAAQPQVVDRAARVRERIHRNQARASSREHSMIERR